MKALVSLLMVMFLLLLVVEVFAQPPGAAGPAPGGDEGRVGRAGARGGDGGGRAPGDFGAFRPAAPTPVMMSFQNFIFVVLGNVMYKVDPQEMKVVGVVMLTPPGMRITAEGAQPLPPPPPPPPADGG